MDARDFDEFFRSEYPKLVALAAALTGDRELARDVAQDALGRAFRRWDAVARLDRPGAWTRRVALNLVTDSRRRGRRDRTLATRLSGRSRDTADPAYPPDDRFWQAVRALPDRQREAVALYYLADRGIADVAASMDIAPGTVKATLAKARRSLARSLELEDR